MKLKNLLILKIFNNSFFLLFVIMVFLTAIIFMIVKTKQTDLNQRPVVQDFSTKVWVSKPLSCCNEKWSEYVRNDVADDLRNSIQGIGYFLSELGSHEHLYDPKDLEYNQKLIDQSIKNYFSDQGILLYEIERKVTNQKEDRRDYDGLQPTRVYFQIEKNDFDEIRVIDDEFVIEEEKDF